MTPKDSSQFEFFAYQDYRSLLRDYIEYRKSKGQVFSYRWFSERAGYSSPNILHLIISGKRSLSTDGIEKVIEVFKWGAKEAQFFKLLVGFNQSKSSAEKQRIAKDLMSLKVVKKLTPVRANQFLYYSQWYHIPIRELVRISAKPLTCNEIAQRLIAPISEAQVQQSIQLLLELGLIRTRGAWYEVVDAQLTTGDEVISSAVRDYHKSCMDMAKASLDNLSAIEREISSTTLTLSPENLAEAKLMIQEFRKKLSALETNEANNEVVQFGFQMFPLTKRRY